MKYRMKTRLIVTALVLYISGITIAFIENWKIGLALYLMSWSLGMGQKIKEKYNNSINVDDLLKHFKGNKNLRNEIYKKI